MAGQTRKHNSSKRRSGYALAACIVVAFLSTPLFVGVSFGHEGHGTEEVGEFDLDAPRYVSPQTAEHMGLRTEEIGIHPVEAVVELSGVVKPRPDLHRIVVSRVSGKVIAVYKQIGDRVKEGEVLATIDSPEFARSLYEVRKLEVDYQRLLLDIERSKAKEQQLIAEAEVAQALVDFAKTNYTRAQSLVSEGITQKEVAQRKVGLAQAVGDLKLKQIDRELARKESEGLDAQAQALRLSREALLIMNNIDPSSDIADAPTGALEIKAEADGVVIERWALSGQWVEAGESLFEVGDYSSVQIEGELPESLIPRVRQRSSNKVRVRIPSDPSFMAEGTVRYIAPRLDPIKRTAHLIIDVPNKEGNLRGEMWVNLSVVLREVKSALVVPRSAVVIDGPIHFVFIQNGDQYEKQDITPGVMDDQFVEVRNGLAPGDVVVVQGAYSLTQLRPKGKRGQPKATSTAGTDGYEREPEN